MQLLKALWALAGAALCCFLVLVIHAQFLKEDCDPGPGQQPAPEDDRPADGPLRVQEGADRGHHASPARLRGCPDHQDQAVVRHAALPRGRGLRPAHQPVGLDVHAARRAHKDHHGLLTNAAPEGPARGLGCPERPQLGQALLPQTLPALGHRPALRFPSARHGQPTPWAACTESAQQQKGSAWDAGGAPGPWEPSLACPPWPDIGCAPHGGRQRARTGGGSGRRGSGPERRGRRRSRGLTLGHRSGLSLCPRLSESLLFSYPFSIYSIDQRANLF